MPGKTITHNKSIYKYITSMQPYITKNKSSVFLGITDTKSHRNAIGVPVENPTTP